MHGYHISTNNIIQHKERIWFLLKDCFWSKNVPLSYVEKFINHSFCFGVYKNDDGQLVGFGRVVTDYTTYAYICDVIIDVLHRKRRLGSALINAILTHSELQGLKTWSLKITEDARRIYEQKGFQVVDCPNSQLEINDLDIYSRVNFRCDKSATN